MYTYKLIVLLIFALLLNLQNLSVIFPLLMIKFYVFININSAFARTKENHCFNEYIIKKRKEVKRIVSNIFNTKMCKTFKKCYITMFIVTLLFHNKEAFLVV